MDLKLPALVTSALVVLMMIIGLATPLWVGENVRLPGESYTFDATYYIRDVHIEVLGIKGTLNMWEHDCKTDDDCKSGVSQLKAGFAFVFMGMLANLAVIACLVAANGFVPLPAPAGEKMVTTGAAAVAAFLYFLGVIMAVNGWPATSESDTFTDTADIAVGSIFLILGLFAAVAVPAMCFMGLEDGEAAAPGAATATEAKEMPNTADVEAPPAEAPPASSAE